MLPPTNHRTMKITESCILQGRIVTMNAKKEVFNQGFLVINNGHIEGVFPLEAEIPSKYEQYLRIDIQGTIYPGMLDLHNHFVYNVLPLWVVPEKYSNRSQWPKHPEYRASVTKPIRHVLAKYSSSSKALVRFVEAKALVGGTTTGQGMRTRVNGGSKIFVGAMRNVEEPMDSKLPPAGTRIPNLKLEDGSAEEQIELFRKALTKEGQGAYFYHLSEGTDQPSRQHFLNLETHNLITDKLVGIHSLGLQPDDIAKLAEKGAKIVWSPFSNQLLYGKTLDLNMLKASGIRFSIGCDWTPTGSKNLLQELKVAAFCNKNQGNPFSDYELIKAVTLDAAEVAGWGAHLGSLEKGKLADIVVVQNGNEDPYKNLIQSVEKDVVLVMVGGVGRYGSRSIMEFLHAKNLPALEHMQLAGEEKCFYLQTPTSEINHIGFAEAWTSLKEIMSDLAAFIKKMKQEQTELMVFGKDPTPDFCIELDNEFYSDEDVLRLDDEVGPQLMADLPMLNRIDLDEPLVAGDNYWQRIDAQENIDGRLKKWLHSCYENE